MNYVVYDEIRMTDSEKSNITRALSTRQINDQPLMNKWRYSLH